MLRDIIRDIVSSTAVTIEESVGRRIWRWALDIFRVVESGVGLTPANP
jgi:hypothetical protein